MKTWLVAHRGAPQEAQENTLEAFAAARKYRVGYIELDVRVTADGHAVIHHDPVIGDTPIAQATYHDLRMIDTKLATFEEIVDAHREQPLFVELKSPGSGIHTVSYLKTVARSFATSFLQNELAIISNAGIEPNRLFLAQHYHSFGLLKRVSTQNLGGITINKWLLTPLLYVRAQRNGIKIMVYTVNSVVWARIIRRLYPAVLLCTDRPDKLEKLK